jgi:hypothetical protein
MSPELLDAGAGEDGQAWSIASTSARFLAQGELVDHGGADGGHGEARGCSKRRRRGTAVKARVSEFR